MIDFTKTKFHSECYAIYLTNPKHQPYVITEGKDGEPLLKPFRSGDEIEVQGPIKVEGIRVQQIFTEKQE